MTRLESAELTSGIDALVLGAGLGAMFPQWFSPPGLIVFSEKPRRAPSRFLPASSPAL